MVLVCNTLGKECPFSEPATLSCETEACSYSAKLFLQQTNLPPSFPGSVPDLLPNMHRVSQNSNLSMLPDKSQSW